MKLLDDFKFSDPENDQPYHAMILEYMAGGDLAQFCQKMLENGEFGKLFEFIKVCRRRRERAAVGRKRRSSDFGAAGRRSRFGRRVLSVSLILFRVHPQQEHHPQRHQSRERPPLGRRENGLSILASARFNSAQIKIADFNVSKAAAETVKTAIVGTMENMPPEALKSNSQEEVSFARDIWPLGILFHMLAPPTWRCSGKARK